MENQVFTLENGVKIPATAFGTYFGDNGSDLSIMSTAIESGYRCFDTASFYQTESILGQAMAQSGIARDEFFIISKVWKDEMGYDATLQAFEHSLERLKTDYLDLYLIHWPRPTLDCADWQSVALDTWRALEFLYQNGRVRAIGVSNFLPHHLEHILHHCQVIPMVNQLEFHPGYTQQSAIQYCKEHDILVQGWSPLGRTRVLNDPLIVELADKYQVSPAQICLRFALQKGIHPIPKASTRERMLQNQDIFSFTLSQLDVYRLETMPPIGWSGEHPDRKRMI